MSEEHGRKVFDQMLALFVGPEIEQRQAAGLLERPVTLRRVQVVFFPDGRERAIRLNDEVRATMKVRVAKSSSPQPGKTVFESDIEEIESISLKDEVDDPNAGHVTAIRLGSRWHLSFDFRYNKAHIREHAAAAEEFLAAARDCLAARRDRAALEAMFAAAELAAKAILLSSLTIRTKTNHRAIHSAFNRWASWGNLNPQIRDTFNTLVAARSSARYLAGTVDELDLTGLRAAVEDLISEAKRLGGAEVDRVV